MGEIIRNNFRAKNKLGFLDGTITKPANDTPEAALWVPVNSTLIGWIHSTLESTLRSTVTYTDDVIDLWTKLHERFSIVNGPRIHELRTLLTECKQMGHPVVSYYGQLKKIWDELAGYSTVPACTYYAAAAYAKEKEAAKVHDFLVGLDTDKFDNMVSSLLLTDPLPSMNIVFAKAITEERRHIVARHHDTKIEQISFAAQGTARSHGGPVSRGGERSKDGVVCSHCDHSGHEQDSCFKLIGYPEWWYAENRQAAGGGCGVGRTGRGGGRASRGKGKMANAAGPTNNGGASCANISDADRSGLPLLSDAQWTTLVAMLNKVSASSSTEKLSGPHLEDPDWSM